MPGIHKRRKILAPAIVLLLVSLSGCTTKLLVMRGDSNLNANNPSRALNYYNNALSHDASLNQNPQFVQNRTRARTESHHMDGMRSFEKGQWEKAIEHFQAALESDPNFADARVALDRTREHGILDSLKNAVQSAKGQNIPRALDYLQAGLRLQPDNEKIRFAIRHARPLETAPASEPEKLYAQGEQFIAEKRWDQAVKSLEAALKLEPYHILAHARLAAAEKPLRSALSKANNAKTSLKNKDLRHAEQDAKEALATWPHCEDAKNTLGQVQALLKQAQDHFSRGSEAGANGDWETALSEFDNAIAIDPKHPEAPEAGQASIPLAARDLCRRGDKLLSEEKIEDAERAFLDAMDFEPNKPEAIVGLSRVSHALALRHESKKEYGNALLRYFEADNLRQDEENLKKIQEMEGEIIKRLAFRVRFEALSESDSQVTQLENLLEQTIVANPPDCVSFLLGPADPARPAAFSATVGVAGLEVAKRLERDEKKNHSYESARKVNNPDIPKLNRQLALEKNKLNRMQADSRLLCAQCAGSGQTLCATCKGRGEVATCRDCRGQGRVSVRGRGIVACKSCGGDGGIRPCKDCREGRSACSLCMGTGSRAGVTSESLEQQRQQIALVQNALSKAPKQVDAPYTAQWPYTLKHYEKSGRARLALELTEPGATAPLMKTTHESLVKQQDVTIDSPRPDIGLQADPLVLPTDADTRAEALRVGVEESVALLLTKIMRQKVAQARNRAQTLAKQNDKPLEANEAAIDEIVLLNWLDYEKAEQQLDGLRQQAIKARARP